MSREAEELRALLQHKKQTISELDRLLYQEITTQNILTQIIADNSISESLSQVSNRSGSISNMESSCSSIESSQLMVEVDSINQFMINCVRNKLWGSDSVSKQVQSSVEKPKNFAPLYMSECNALERSGADQIASDLFANQKRHDQTKQFQSLKQKPFPMRLPEDSIKPQIITIPQIATMELRQEQIRKERQAIRNAIIKEQQLKQPTQPNFTVNKNTNQLPRHIFQQQYTTHSLDLESFKRKSALNRTINQIRKAKRSGFKLEQTISSKLTFFRF